MFLTPGRSDHLDLVRTWLHLHDHLRHHGRDQDTCQEGRQEAGRG